MSIVSLESIEEGVERENKARESRYKSNKLNQDRITAKEKEKETRERELGVKPKFTLVAQQAWSRPDLTYSHFL